MRNRLPLWSIFRLGLAVFSQHQLDELALGLELSGQPFLWVVRSDLANGSQAEYPKGFMERVAGIGKIVEWAPQEKVIRLEPTDTDPRTAEIAQWTDRDQIGQGAILSALSNTLFDVYCSDSYTAKSLWDELDRKYNTEEQGLKKYYVFKFMLYQMVEDKSVAEQTHEIINLEHALANAEMKLSEKFLVMSTVDKFSKSWENFGMTLKHQKEKLSLQGTKNKKSKANKPCWNCGQVEHWAKLCPNKRAKTGHATVNMVMGGSSGASTSGAIEGPSVEGL
ncbi:UNVERIFIED_CONTAM: UDP-glycosyltransferase 13 [Sesamum calycinum]|uniref:UDP-glycosyltransferase 13 n=1 Tax=Sesamum calycinum TaxID=2727403 RepID=A0AAW2NGU3_9LAMI